MTDEALPRADVGYLRLVSRTGPRIVLRVPAGVGARDNREYGAPWSKIVKGAKLVLGEHSVPQEDFVVLDHIVAPWDWNSPWGGRLLMADLRERAKRCDAAFAGEQEYTARYLYDWTGEGFTLVRAPLAAPHPAEPAP